MRSASCTDLRTILIKGYIPYIVNLILDRPVPTIEQKQAFGIGGLWRETRDPETHFAGGVTSTEFSAVILDANHLSNVRKFDIFIEFRAGPDTTYFETTVPLVDRFMRRGEKPPCGVVQCRREASVDCPSL